MSSTIRSLRRCSPIPIHSSTASLAVQELRNRILQDKTRGKYCSSDLNRIQTDDWWLSIFLQSYDYDVDITSAVLLECLKWRTQFDVEHLSLLALKPLLDRKLMYLHGHDIKGNTILWINLAQYRNGEAGFEKLFVFWVDRHFMETRGRSLLILADMSGCGLKNMDFNIFKFILHSLKYYYPNMVEDFLVYDTPAILNASWKVVKSWIDIGHPTIHQVTKDSVTQFIDSSHLRPHQGGNDEFQFSMDELAKCMPTMGRMEELQLTNVLTEDSHIEADLDSFPMKRSVKFDDDEEDVNRKTPLILGRRPSKGPGRRVPLPLKPIAEKRMQASENEWIRNAFLSVSPRDELILNRVDGETDFVDVVAVKNMSDSNIMFKIKTTSPEKFRVRPSAGIISAGKSDTIRVYLQSEYKNSCSREKFLLMAVETDNEKIESFAEIWKNAENENKVEQKLKCKVNDDISTDSSSNGIGNHPERRSSLLSSQQDQIDRLRQMTLALGNTQRLIIVVLGFLFAIQIIAMMYERSNYNSLRIAIETMTANVNRNHDTTNKIHQTTNTPSPPVHSHNPTHYEEDL